MNTKIFTKRLNSILYLFMAALLTTICVGCYRMPDDDECSLVPTTNNPDVTREKGGGGFAPGGSF